MIRCHPGGQLKTSGDPCPEVWLLDIGPTSRNIAGAILVRKMAEAARRHRQQVKWLPSARAPVNRPSGEGSPTTTASTCRRAGSFATRAEQSMHGRTCRRPPGRYVPPAGGSPEAASPQALQLKPHFARALESSGTRDAAAPRWRLDRDGRGGPA